MTTNAKQTTEAARELVVRGGPFTELELRTIYRAADSLNGGPRDWIDNEMGRITRSCRSTSRPARKPVPTPLDEPVAQAESALALAIADELDKREAMFRARDEVRRLSATTWLINGRGHEVVPAAKDSTPTKVEAAKEAVLVARDAWASAQEAQRRAQRALTRLAKQRERMRDAGA